MLPIKRKSAVSILVALVASCSVEAPSTSDVASSIEPAPAKTQSRYEIDFMVDMIDHHQMAIEMAEICLEKAVHEELLELCSDIIATQSAEIATMQTWLENWYGVSYEPMMKPSAERKLAEMNQMSSERSRSWKT